MLPGEDVHEGGWDGTQCQGAEDDTPHDVTGDDTQFGAAGMILRVRMLGKMVLREMGLKPRLLFLRLMLTVGCHWGILST